MYVVSTVQCRIQSAGDNFSWTICSLLGNPVQKFVLEVIAADPTTGADVFELDSDGTHPVIRGNRGYVENTGAATLFCGTCAI